MTYYFKRNNDTLTPSTISEACKFKEMTMSELTTSYREQSGDVVGNQSCSVVIPRKRVADGIDEIMSYRMGGDKQGDVQEEKAFLLTNLNNGNRFGNCYFPLRTSLPPGQNGLYKIIVNDIYFYCSQPFFVKGDSFQITNLKTNEVLYNNVLTTDIEPEDIKTEAALQAMFKNAILTSNTYVAFVSGTDIYFSITINWNGSVTFTNSSNDTLELKMSGGYYHFFNYSKTTLRIKPQETIIFRGLTWNGPSFYLAQSGTRPLVATRNDDNNQYNAIGIYYNYNQRFRDHVQMSGTMIIIVSNPSNFRIVLTDDSGRELQLRSPVFVHLTIAPY